MPVSHSRRLAVTHGALELLRTAEVDLHGLPERVDAVLVAVQFVVLGAWRGRWSHMPLAYVASSVRSSECLQLVRLGAHHGEAGPPVEVVGVVGKAAAELAVGDLPVVDVPVDLVVEHAEVLDLQERPLAERRPGPCGSVKGGASCSWIFLVPVLAAEVVGRVDAEQVGDVRVEAVEEVQLARVDRLFDHVGVVVADLGEAVGDVLGQRVVIGLEDEADLRAFERMRRRTPGWRRRR